MYSSLDRPKAGFSVWPNILEGSSFSNICRLNITWTLTDLCLNQTLAIHIHMFNNCNLLALISFIAHMWADCNVSLSVAFTSLWTIRFQSKLWSQFQYSLWSPPTTDGNIWLFSSQMLLTFTIYLLTCASLVLGYHPREWNADEWWVNHSGEAAGCKYKSVRWKTLNSSRTVWWIEGRA